MIINLLKRSLIVSAMAHFSYAGDLLLDLDADKKVKVNSENKVISWGNSIEHKAIKEFTGQDKGRAAKGSGLPKLINKDSLIGDHRSIEFKQQELVCFNEDAFDCLTTGAGYTWFCVVKMANQRVGLKDVNAFFGNLRNGAKYEGLWGCVDDDNSLWSGARNGKTFGRFDVNNPKVSGPKLQKNRYYLIASRMQKGLGDVRIELFLNDLEPISVSQFPVNPEANPSKMCIGQERDAVEHPGKESFDGAITRLLIYEGGLGDIKFQQEIKKLLKMYSIKTEG